MGDINDIFLLRLFLFSLPNNDLEKDEIDELNGVLSVCLSDESAVEYRRSVVNDLLENRQFICSARNIFKNLISERDDYMKVRTVMQKATRDTNKAEATVLTRLARHNAIYCKQLMGYFESLQRLLGAYRFESAALNQLKSEIGEIIAKDRDAVMQLCGYVESTAFNLVSGHIIIEADDLFKIGAIDILPYTKEPPKKTSLFFRRNDKPSHSNESFRDDGMAICLMKRLDQAVLNLSKCFFGFLDDIRIAFNFYFITYNYVCFLEEKGIPYSFPEFGSDIKITGLYDVSLLRDIDASGITPNNFEFDNSTLGMVIMGKNGTGKTVYLRSLYNACLLSQMGLPLPAASSRIKLCDGIYCVNAYVEADSSKSSDAFGGFENEVVQIKNVLDSVSEGSLVFLNEVFQTTASEEAASALTDVLNCLSSIGAGWICVSHLQRLKDFADSNHNVILIMREHVYIKNAV